MLLFRSSSSSQHQPYMYPIDFSSAGTHPGYAMPIGPFNGAEIYGVSGLGGNSHEGAQQQPIHMEQYQDIAGQYSQGIAEIQNPNITSVFSQPQQAAKRWDGMYENENINYNTKKYYTETDKLVEKPMEHAFKHGKTGQIKSHAFENIFDRKDTIKTENSYLFERNSDDVDGSSWKPLFDGKPLEIDAGLLNLDSVSFNHTPNQNLYDSFFTASELDKKLFGSDSNSEKRKKYKSKEGFVFEPLEEKIGEKYEISTKRSTNFGIEDVVVSHIQRINSNKNKQNHKTRWQSGGTTKLKLKKDNIKFKKLKTHYDGSWATLEETLLPRETAPQVDYERPVAEFLTGEVPVQWNMGESNKFVRGSVDNEPYTPSNDAGSKNNLFKIPQGSKSNSFDITISQNYRVQDDEDTPKANNVLQKKIGPFEKRDTLRQTDPTRYFENEGSKYNKEKMFYNIAVTDNKRASLFIPKELNSADSETINSSYPITSKTQFANLSSKYAFSTANDKNNNAQNIKKSDRFLKNVPEAVSSIEKLSGNSAVEQFKQGFVSDFSPKVFDITVSDERSNFSVFIPRPTMFLHNQGTVKTPAKIRLKRSYSINKRLADSFNPPKSQNHTQRRKDYTFEI